MINAGSTSVRNLCSNSKLGALQVRMAVPPKLVGEQHAEYPDYKQTLSTPTLLKIETPEFDGIACNDGSRTSSTVSKRSFYQA